MAAKVKSCPHDMPSPASCVDCMNEGILEPAPRVKAGLERVSEPFKARYEGHCAACNLDIFVGQEIVRMSDDTHRHWLCERPRGLF